MINSQFQALGSWGRTKKAGKGKNEGETKASEGGRACKNFFNDPLPPTFGLMRCRKVKMSTCQLAGGVLQFLARQIPHFANDNLTACFRLPFSMVSYKATSSNPGFHPFKTLQIL